MLENRSLNIKQLTLENMSKSTSPIFDPERDIDPRLWNSMLQGLQRQSGYGKLCHLSYANLIFPDKKEDLNLTDIDESVLKLLILSNPGNAEILLIQKILFPERHNEFLQDKGSVETTINNLKQSIFQPTLSTSLFLERASSNEQLFPGHFTQNPMTNSYKDSIRAYIAKDIRTEVWTGAGTYLANFRILYPDDFLKLPEVNRTTCQNILRSAQQNATYYSLRFFLNLKIICAESINITDTSIDIKMPTPYTATEIQAIPEKRNF